MTPTWELVCRSEEDATFRLRVPGGWLYKVTDHLECVSLVFVPQHAGKTHPLRDSHGA